MNNYLDGIQASAYIEIGNINILNKMSSIISNVYKGSKGEEQWEYCEYDPIIKHLYTNDITGDEIEKYIDDGRLMGIKILGVREDARLDFEKWKVLNGCEYRPPRKMLKAIFFPIKYDQSLTERYIPRLLIGGKEDFGDTFEIISDYQIKQKNYQGIDHVDYIMKQKGMDIASFVNVELLVFRVIGVGSEGYVIGCGEGINREEKKVELIVMGYDYIKEKYI